MNPYKVLQVDCEAELEVIESAYRRLAGKYHPDKDPSRIATDRMKAINAAYDLLKDPKLRGQYDRKHEEELRIRYGCGQTAGEGASPAKAPESSFEHRLKLEIVVSKWSVGPAQLVAVLIALPIYFPWGIGILLGLWGLVRLLRRCPEGVTITTGAMTVKVEVV